MRYIFNCLFLLFCSLSFCFAGVGEEFAYEIGLKVAQLKLLHEKSQNFNESNAEEYFAKGRVRDNQINKTKELFRLCYLNMDSFAKKRNWMYVDENELGKELFSAYCKQVYLIKNLHTERSSAQPDSTYHRDLEQGIESLGIYHRYFPKAIAAMSSFLRIEQNGKKDGLTKYFVRLNDVDWYLSQRRHARNFLNRLSLLDLEKLSLPKRYEQHLQREVNRIKKENAQYFAGKTFATSPVGRDIKNADMSLLDNAEIYLSTENYSVLSQIVLIQERDEMVCFRPLDIRFHDGTSLSPEERALNSALLEKLLERKAPISVAAASAPSRPVGKKVKKRKKGTNKQSSVASDRVKGSVIEKQQEPVSESEPSTSSFYPVVYQDDLEEASSVEKQQEPVSESEPCTSSSSPVVHQDGLEEASSVEKQQEPVSESEPCTSSSSPVVHQDGLEEPSSIEKQQEPVSGSEPCTSSSSSVSGSEPCTSSSSSVVHQDDLEEDAHLFVRNWLADIIAKSQSKDEMFGIFQKALALDSMITKYPGLLEQTQEAAASLAAMVQELEEKTSLKKYSQKVEERLESDFLYFMETPLCYLKDLRFGFVNTLFEALGIKIDKSMAGSRIKFSFRGKITGIHLHDKYNGELDGGRISSLRKFLIECGFMLNENKTTVAQKTARRVGRGGRGSIR